MWKSLMVLYFYIAAGLVSGEWQPQDYGQNQLRHPFPPSVPAHDQRPIYIRQTNSMPQARPCRRRNSGDPGAVFTDSGWVPLPLAQPPIVQQTGSQPFQPELKAQSLTENKAPNVDQEKAKEEEQTVRKTEYPDKIVEFVEKSSQPNQISGKSYKADSETRRAIPDKQFNNIFLEKPKPEQESGTALDDKRGYPNHASTDQKDSHERSIECEDSVRNGEENQDLRYDDSEQRDVGNKRTPSEIHEQAEKLLSECIHQSRRSMQDFEEFEGDSRKFEAKSPSSSELDKTDNTQPNLLKSVSTPSKNPIDKNNLKVYLENPAKNAGKWNSERQVSLLENGKVCYACSSYYDPSCWRTNATTTVKFCNMANNACLTKMYKIEGKSILIRDCGHTCNEDNGYNIGQKMTSCSMCHNDLCNSAYAINGLNILLITFAVYSVKFTLQ